MTKYSIIIASYNEAESLKSCLTSICTANFKSKDLEIIVIDNNSTDNTYLIVKDFPQVIYLKENRQGASFARNCGIDNSTGDIIVFLDADTTVTKEWLANLLLPFKNSKTGAVGGGILPANNKSLISQYLGVSLFMRYPRYGGERKIKGFPSCNLAIRKNLLGKGFDTNTFTTYGEDKDLCMEVIKKGYNVIFKPEAIIYHDHPASFSSFFSLLVNSSKGRVSFGKKYKNAPDIILFNYHLPGAYLLLLVISIAFKDSSLFFITLCPALLYLVCSSILSYIKCKRFFLCFFVKPLLDTITLYTIYIAYTIFKLRSSIQGVINGH